MLYFLFQKVCVKQLLNLKGCNLLLDRNKQCLDIQSGVRLKEKKAQRMPSEESSLPRSSKRLWSPPVLGEGISMPIRGFGLLSLRLKQRTCRRTILKGRSRR